MARRESIELPGFGHTNPIPAAARKGPFVFSGGFTGRDPVTRVLPPTLHEQVSNVFAHVRTLMTEVGGTPDDIMRMTVWLADFRNREALNVEWLAMFPDARSRPARQVISAELDSGVLVQADLIAIVGT